MPQLPHTHIDFPLRLNSGNHNFYLRRFQRLAPFPPLDAAHVRRPLDTNYINKRTTKDAALPHMRISLRKREDGGRSAQKLFQFSPFYRKLRTIQYLAFLLSLVLYPAVVVCLFSAWLATKCQSGQRRRRRRRRSWRGSDCLQFLVACFCYFAIFCVSLYRK